MMMGPSAVITKAASGETLEFYQHQVEVIVEFLFTVNPINILHFTSKKLSQALTAQY